MIPALTGILAPHGLATSFESIATVTVGAGGQSTVSFGSIPQTYQHLQIRATFFQTAGTTKEALLTFNGVSLASYTTHQLYGNGSSAGAYAATGLTYTYIGQSSGTNLYTGVSITDILDYQDTNKYKTVRSLWGWDANGSGQVFLSSGLYSANTNAITSITITQSSSSFAQYSSFALYGVKA